MPAYTYGDYLYFNNIIDTPKEHHNHFILNQKPDLYIKSPLTPKLFVDETIKN